MKRLLLVIIITLSATRGVGAQSLPIDRLTPPLPTASERKAADVASWATVIAAMTADVVTTWKQHCSAGRTWDNCEPRLVMSGLRVGATIGAAEIVKVIVHRARPCAPDACGIDSPNSSFYSMHTALAFSTIGGPSLSISLPLALSTGGLRIAAGKHWLTDTLVGAGVGALTSRIR